MLYVYTTALSSEQTAYLQFPVDLLVTLLLPGGRVEDDLDAPVHHVGPLVGVAAPLVELVYELPLPLHAGVAHPAPGLGVPHPEVDREAVYQSVRATLTQELQCLTILTTNSSPSHRPE